MPKYPEIRETPGFINYLVSMDRGRVSKRLAEGWEIHPDYQSAYDADPKSCDSWPMRKAVDLPEPEAAPVAVAVEASSEEDEEE